MRLHVAGRARSDLMDIALYIARDNPDRAISFADEIEAYCESLIDFPERSPVHSWENGRIVRRAVYGNYLIFHEIRGDELIVLRILHGARNISRLL